MIRIKDLMGGHSGVEIHKGRANAHVLMTRMLQKIAEAYPYRLYQYGGSAKETAIATALISYIDNAREDIDYGLVANLTKLLAITAESKDELHASSYEATQDVIIEKILNLIIKEGF